VQRNRVATTPRRGQVMDKVQQKAEAMKETRDGSHKIVNVVRTGLWLIAVRKREPYLL